MLGYADFCPMFYHYSNGDCRIQESSHKYESFGAEICPNCKCNELYSSTENDKNYAICYETACAQNYLYSDSRGNGNDKDEGWFNIDDFSDFAAIRIKISNKQYSKYEYITCWSFESEQYKSTSFYSYLIKCPSFEDICYAKNPWSCNGHGMINTKAKAVSEQCFCNHGYIGCDCTIRDTQSNRANSALIAKTCSVEQYEENPIYVNAANYDDEASADGFMPIDEKDVEWDSLGLLNITMQSDKDFAIENVLRTLRLWIAINVKIAESNVWIQSYQALKHHHRSPFDSHSNTIGGSNDGKMNQNYSISIAYYDEVNQNKIVPDLLIKEFHFLFNSKVSKAQIEANDNEFVLYDIYNIKQPVSSTHMMRPSLIVISILSLFCIFIIC